MNNIPNPGKLRISTITAIGDFGLLINLEKLAEKLASSIDTENSTIMTIKYRRGGNKKPKDSYISLCIHKSSCRKNVPLVTQLAIRKSKVTSNVPDVDS